MRSLVPVLALAVAAVLPVESRAAQARLRCPRTLQDAQQLPVEVTIDVGTTPLGAYSVTITYDAAALEVGSVAGGKTVEFAGTPTTSTPVAGTTNLAALQAANLTSPTGSVSVAKITLNVVGTARTTTSVGLAVNHVFDTNGNAIVPATATGCSIDGGGSRTDHRH